MYVLPVIHTLAYILELKSDCELLLPSTMLDLAIKPDEAFSAPLNTTKLAPVTVEMNRNNHGVTSSDKRTGLYKLLQH